VHDCFDETIVERELDTGVESPDENVIMTTWHSQESLSEVLWFFINSAFPTHAYEKTCKDWIIAPIGIRIGSNQCAPKLLTSTHREQDRWIDTVRHQLHEGQRSYL
jgi:hypothetical protein